MDSVQQDSCAPLEGQKPKPKRPSGYQRRKAAKQKARQQFLSTLTATGRAVQLTPPTQMPQTLSDVAALARWILINSIKGNIQPEAGERFAYMATPASKLTEAEHIQELARLLADQGHQDVAGGEFAADAGAGAERVGSRERSGRLLCGSEVIHPIQHRIDLPC
jgi:hypothetical protein